MTRPGWRSARLRVALDARTLQDQPLGGVGRSVASLVDAVRDDVDLRLLTDARRPALDTDLPQQALRAPVNATMAAWLQLALPPALRGFDGIFHGPWYGLPFRQPVPMVVTIHDLAFEFHPEWYTPSRLWAYRIQGRWAARTAAHVITDAAAIRREVCVRYRLDPARVSVVPCTVDPTLSATPSEVDKVKVRYELDGRYVVAVGGTPRRGLDVALAAWPDVHRAHPGVRLVVVGQERLDGAVPPGVVVAGRVDDADWAALLAGAELLVYPTAYEGFGYPAAEAAVLGTPTVCARVGSLPEVLGDGAWWLPDRQPSTLAAALVELLGDRTAVARLTAAAKRRTGAFADRGDVRTAALAAYEAAVAAATWRGSRSSAWRRAGRARPTAPHSAQAAGNDRKT